MRLLLTPEECQEARKAVFTGDRKSFKSLARVAVGRIEDDQYNSGLLSALDNSGVRYSKSQDGKSVRVEIPGAGEVSLSGAVRNGYLEFN